MRVCATPEGWRRAPNRRTLARPSDYHHVVRPTSDLAGRLVCWPATAPCPNFACRYAEGASAMRCSPVCRSALACALLAIALATSPVHAQSDSELKALIFPGVPIPRVSASQWRSLQARDPARGHWTPTIALPVGRSTTKTVIPFEASCAHIPLSGTQPRLQ